MIRWRAGDARKYTLLPDASRLGCAVGDVVGWVDRPPEEADGVRERFASHGLALVLLAVQTTTPERLETLCSQVQGYLYDVSLAGGTGASEQLDTGAASERLRAIRAMSSAPVVAEIGRAHV